MKNLFCELKVWLPIIKDFVLAITAVIASYVGLKGLKTWRMQLKVNTEYKLAKSLLKALYQLREAINIFRFPYMSYPRDPDMPKEKLSNLSEEERSWYSMEQAYQKRWEPVSKAVATLNALDLESKMVWGDRIEDEMKSLNKLIFDLRRAIVRFLREVKPNTQEKKLNPEECKKWRDILFAHEEESKDDYLKNLQDVISKIEASLRPYIEKYHR